MCSSESASVLVVLRGLGEPRLDEGPRALRVRRCAVLRPPDALPGVVRVPPVDGHGRVYRLLGGGVRHGPRASVRLFPVCVGKKNVARGTERHHLSSSPVKSRIPRVKTQHRGWSSFARYAAVIIKHRAHGTSIPSRETNFLFTYRESLLRGGDTIEHAFILTERFCTQTLLQFHAAASH